MGLLLNAYLALELVVILSLGTLIQAIVLLLTYADKTRLYPGRMFRLIGVTVAKGASPRPALPLPLLTSLQPPSYGTLECTAPTPPRRTSPSVWLWCRTTTPTWTPASSPPSPGR